ncbi:MAG TPA: DapH/DapD/GlmU-related protein, partial [Kribbella sp.]
MAHHEGDPVTSRIAPSADVDDSARIGDGSSVWHLAQIRENAVLGKNCIVGRGAYVGTGVRMGDNCKIQNYALVYEPASLEDGVFIGPAVVLTNDYFPRAVN